MQRMGIPQPPFRLENKFTKYLTNVYNLALKKILGDFLGQVRSVLIKDNAMTTDGTLEDLLAYFEGNGKKDASRILQERMQLGSVASTLREMWDQAEVEIPDLAEFMDAYLREDTDEFFKKFNADASDKILGIMDDFTINKEELFEQHKDMLRELYIDNCKERILSGLSYQKELFLRKLLDYVEGRSARLDIALITEALENSDERMARFFARDQMARFNKALTLSTFLDAGVTKVKWVTTHDQRVRDSHRVLDGQVFDINNLPDELNDYNCRCGLIPVEYAD